MIEISYTMTPPVRPEGTVTITMSIATARILRALVNRTAGGTMTELWQKLRDCPATAPFVGEKARWRASPDPNVLEFVS